MSAEITNSAQTYTAMAAIQRFEARKFACYSAAKNTVMNSSFNPAAKLDGQALAGTGALVWEGELLELPRRHLS